MLTDRLDVNPEVAAALAEGRPVVALESTLISHGLPYPVNLEVASESEAAVREAGAVPATVAIHAGRFLVGLDEASLLALATAPEGSVRKAARPSLGAALADGGWAATTVSATMVAAHAAGITVFATGGIGGVHRGALGGSAAGGSGGGPGAAAGGGATQCPPTFDISSDLEELGRTPMAIVCAGPKAILDVPATIEYLETRGVPVLAVGQSELPGFYARSAGIAAPSSAADIESAAWVVATHLGLGIGGGILVCVPVPEGDALPDDVARDAVERAIVEASAADINGPALTPWLLARIAELTDGASIRANTALIVNDARVAGRLATLLGQAATH
ncbi:MAG: pseudouridine-5'-phosphate glycosidase [Chloroflexi bacterium]|nr:pseudouridine-5'-phosphate glycosidase [Chloroflexota bacterium]